MLTVFVLIGSVGVLAPLVIYLFAGEGFKLVGDGIAVLF